MTDPLTNLIASGVSGLIGTVAGFFQAKQAADLRKLEIKADADKMVHVEKMATINADIATQKGETDAFVESQRAGTSDKIDAFAVPANAPAWVVAVAVLGNSLAVLGNFLRVVTRPGITWYLVIASRMTPELLPLASTCVGWWFGQRGGRYFSK
jgi:hypothetical protein